MPRYIVLTGTDLLASEEQCGQDRSELPRVAHEV